MGKDRIIDRLFPAKYPFIEMLAQEAAYNELGITALQLACNRRLRGKRRPAAIC
jgi:hypothetical protein